jgi:acetyl-CoA/propionyl-CoA carboxylase biotin carboxyl carrier protein
MGRAAVETARSVGYTGAGTVEFIVDGGHPDDFYFMEMNTRLQVEHPVTELVYGLDLVEWQLRVAAGERLPARPARRGHAVEARVYAEDPARGFLPTGGTVLGLREPAGPHVRVDSGLAPGMAVTSAYDPMLAKVAAWGPDRATALRRLDAALAQTAVLGVTTNIAFLRDLLHDPDVQAGRLDTGLAERVAATAEIPENPDEVLAAAALARALDREPGESPRAAAIDPWDIADGWRVGEHAWTTFRFAAGVGQAAVVRTRGLASADAEVTVGDGAPVTARAEFRDAGGGADSGGTDLTVTYGGRTIRYAYAADGATTWLARDGRAWSLTEVAAAPVRSGPAGRADATVRSPMPGTVIAVHVTAGQPVTEGQPIAVVEAMKMEHTVTSPLAGTVTELTARAGQQVRMDAPLAVIDPQTEDSGSL